MGENVLALRKYTFRYLGEKVVCYMQPSKIKKKYIQSKNESKPERMNGLTPQFVSTSTHYPLCFQYHEIAQSPFNGKFFAGT